MNYDRYDSRPFCPHFYNCKKVDDKEHNKKYMHPCVKGLSCDQINCKYHTRFWYHFNLPTCPYGSSCAMIFDPSHRASYHHVAKKGEHAIRDYMLNCDHCESCIIDDPIHRMTFQHIQPFVFPRDGIAPEFNPDHKEKMCKKCFNKERECTCLCCYNADIKLLPNTVAPPSRKSNNSLVFSGTSSSTAAAATTRSYSAPNKEYNGSPISHIRLSRSADYFSSRVRRIKWGYDFENPPQQVKYERWPFEETYITNYYLI